MAVDTDVLAARVRVPMVRRSPLRYMAHMLPTGLFIGIGWALNAQAQTTQTKIPYESPRSAYVALSKDLSARLKRNAEGWEIVHVSEGRNEGVWTFAPQSHPSFPSVVKRQVIEENGKLFIGMDVLCGGTKEVCDQYVGEFIKMNDQLRKELDEKRATDKGALK